MTDEPRDLRRYMEADTSPVRLQRQWAHIAARYEPRPRRFWLPALGVTAALSVGFGLVALLPELPESDGRPGDAVWASIDRTIDLRDGSTVRLKQGGRMRLGERSADRIVLNLELGQARFDVAHDPARAFVVQAGAAQVRVIGTAFVVDRSEEGEVRVDVIRGVVAVRPAGSDEELRLEEGETWESSTVPTAEDEAGEARAPQPPPVDPSSGPGASKAPPGDFGAAPPSPRATDEREAPEAEPSGAQARPERAPRPQASIPSTGAGGGLSEDAPELLAEAFAARRAGQPNRAARILQRFLDRFPQDSRAGLAAMELGKLRMDRLADPRGALIALRVALRKGGPFAEDALARSVVLEAQLRTGGCAALRDRYLARYPEGVRRADVVEACP